MLGRDFSMRGTVARGRRIGRTLGFPTANIACDLQLVLPKIGVYAAYARLDGALYPAITNIGSNPTVGGTETRVETHLLGFDGDAYGRDMQVYFVSYLREEQRFRDTDALRAQLVSDEARAMEILRKLPIYKDFSV